MTVIQAIEEVFLNEVPEGIFAFTSEVQEDKNQRYKDKVLNSTLCLISPNVSGSYTTTNAQFNDQLNLSVFFLKFNQDKWTKYIDKEANLVEPMRQLGEQVLTRVLYQYPQLITLEEETTIAYNSLYNWGSGNHAGAVFTFIVSQKRLLDLCVKT